MYFHGLCISTLSKSESGGNFFIFLFFFFVLSVVCYFLIPEFHTTGLFPIAWWHSSLVRNRYSTETKAGQTEKNGQLIFSELSVKVFDHTFICGRNGYFRATDVIIVFLK